MSFNILAIAIGATRANDVIQATNGGAVRWTVVRIHDWHACLWLGAAQSRPPAVPDPSRTRLLLRPASDRAVGIAVLVFDDIRHLCRVTEVLLGTICK